LSSINKSRARVDSEASFAFRFTSESEKDCESSPELRFNPDAPLGAPEGSPPESKSNPGAGVLNCATEGSKGLLLFIYNFVLFRNIPGKAARHAMRGLWKEIPRRQSTEIPCFNLM
jgi:hypothetical protein